MRSLRPALRLAQTLRRPPSTIHSQSPSWPVQPRLSVFPAHPTIRIPRRRFYSQQQQQQQTKEKIKEEEETTDGKKEEKEDDGSAKKYAKEDTAPPPDPNKSPFQVFVDTFKSELAKSRELQESIKAIQDESGRIGDSEALRKAKEAYAKAKVRTNNNTSLSFCV